MKRILAFVLSLVMLVPSYQVSAKEWNTDMVFTEEVQETVVGEAEETKNVATLEESTEIVIDATDYGADPTGMTDSAEAIWQAMEAAKEASEGGTKSVTLSFPKGEYHIYKDRAQQREYHTSNTNSIENPIKYIGLLIEDQKNLTIEGNGSLFMMHGNMMALAVVRSEHIKLHNFSWDFAVPTVTEMTIIGMEDNYTDFYIPQCFPYEISGNTIVWKSDVSPYTGRPYWTRTGIHENSYSVVVYRPEEEMTRIYGTGDGPFSSATGIEQISENVVRIYYNTRPSMQKIGMVMQFCSSAVRHTAGAFTWESKEVTAEKVNVHFMDGFGWLIQMSENVYYKECNLMPRENSGHITVSFADGIHASGAAGEIVIEDCNFSHTHDDPINFHGTFTRVEERIDDNTLKLKYIHNQQGGFPQYHVGDMVQFFTRDTLESTDGEAQYEVSEIVSQPGENGNDLRTMVVKFKETLPANLSDSVSGQPKYVAENVTYAPQVTIRNCTFKNVATRGILCTTRNKVLIENNIFYPTSMATIFLSNDSDNWYESGPIRNMTIRGNVFYVKDIGGKTSWTYASAIYIHPVTKGGGFPAATNPIHKNITIEDNIFYMDEDAVVKAESVENLVFRNNTVLRMNPEVSLTLNPANTALATGTSMSLNLQKTGNTNNKNIDNVFDFTKSKDVKISGNTYDDGLKRYVVADADTQTTLQVGDSILSIVSNANGTPSEAVGEVKFVSSDPKVAYVDDYGTVTGLTEGEVTVYAYYRWNGTVIKSNEVTLNITGEPATAETWNDGITIKREGNGSYEVSKNSYKVDLQSGDLYQGNNSVKNLLLYRPTEEQKENLRAIVKVEGMPVNESEQWDTASFLLYKDDDNYISVGKKSHYNGFVYVVEKNATAQETGGEAEDNTVTDGYLGITKVGETVTLFSKVENGEWEQVAEITNHTLGNDYQIGLVAWESNDRSKKVTFSDLKVGSAGDSFETLEAAAPVDFRKPVSVDVTEETEEFLSNHAEIMEISMEELGFEKTAPLAEKFYHVVADATKSRATLCIKKDEESKEVQVFDGDYRTPLLLTQEGNTYTTPVEFHNGINTFYVRVYAEDGITYKQYIVAVTYTPDYVEKVFSDGLLKEIIFDGKDITGEFIGKATPAKQMVMKDTVLLKVTAEEEGATVTFGLAGRKLPDAVSNVKEGEIQLYQGQTRIQVVITSADKTTQKSYYFDVEKGAYLSDLPWTHATVGYGDGVKRDANHNGSAIVLPDENGNPVTFEKGLGVHATSVIKYNIAGAGYKKLEGYAGIDYCQYYAQYGDVKFVINIDGQQVFDSGLLTKTSPMVKIEIEIPENAQELELKAEEGGNNWNDHANWAGMKFVDSFPVQVVDKSTLQSVVDSCKDTNNDREIYTEESWNAFTAALQTAQEVLAADTTTQEAVEAAKEALEAAIGGLTEKTPDVPAETVAAPTANPAAGEVEAGTKVTLATTTAGAKIYYTTGAGTPDQEYTEATEIVINVATTIKAVAKKEGCNDSEMVTFAYTVKDVPPVTPEDPETPDDGTWGDILPEDREGLTEVPAGIWAAGIKELTYNGTKQTQEFRVYDGNKMLVAGKDYTATIKNNQNACTDMTSNKAPQIVLKMKGDYKGTKIIKFSIKQISINDVVVDDFFVTYNGKKYGSLPVLSWNGKKLTSKDVTVGTVTANTTENGDYDATVTITGKGNFTGERDLKLIVGTEKTQIDMSKVKVTAPKKVNWAETEEGITLSGVVVKNGTTELKADEDYTVSYENNKAAGTATLVITGTAKKENSVSYHGVKRVTFTINGTAASKFVVNGLEKTYTYTGEEIEPLDLDGVSVSVKGGSILNSEDYEVSYEKNVNKGTATMYLTGNPEKGYTGTKKVTFKIAAAELGETYKVIMDEAYLAEDGTYKVPYTAGGTAPEVTVENAEGKELTAGVDYTVSYKNNKAVAPATATATKAPTVVIKGKGNYAKSKELKFAIVKKEVKADAGILTVSAKDKSLTNKAGSWKQTFKVYDVNGKALSANKDYSKSAVYYKVTGTEEVNLNENPSTAIENGDTIKIVVSLTGNNYSGEASGTYRIIDKNNDISKAVFKIAAKEYTGEEIELTKADITKAELKKASLVLEEHYKIVKYEKNINKGTAKVTFRGINDFGGEKTVTFKITQKDAVSHWWSGIVEALFR